MQLDCTQGRSAVPSSRVSGHFGEWIQGRYGENGPVVLVTLACDALFAEASMTGDSPLSLKAIGPQAVDLDQLAQLLRQTNRPETGEFTLLSNLPPGFGTGSSTAGLVALARAAGVAEETLPAACLKIEGATDPLMLPYPDSVLWCSRQARISEQIKPLPRCEIIGGYFGGSIRTDPTDCGFPDISDLLPAWRDANQRADLSALAALASDSAQRTTRLRGPAGDPSEAVAHNLGALGHARAHTGSARAFIFSLGTVPDGAENALESAGLRGAFRFFTGAV